MSSASIASRHLVMHEALRRMIVDARAECAQAVPDGPEHAFYNGVEAAAIDALQPARVESKPVNWLALEAPLFREGYLRGSSRIALAQSTDAPLLSLALPEFESGR